MIITTSNFISERVPYLTKVLALESQIQFEFWQEFQRIGEKIFKGS
jgi:hypothetical protein